MNTIDKISIEEILGKSEYLDSDGSVKLLDRAKIDILKNITYNGTNAKILGVNNISQNSKAIIYEVLALLYKIGYNETLKLLKNDNVFSNINNESKERNIRVETNRGILFGNPLLKDSQLRKLDDIEIYRRPETTTTGAFKCPVCGGFKTTTIQKQIRASDESATCFNTCNECNHRWRIG
jgi:DNA-directed RNA polymerase subunit M/transcription elongation factor TFIIS